jgi:hypothetical protein
VGRLLFQLFVAAAACDFVDCLKLSLQPGFSRMKTFQVAWRQVSSHLRLLYDFRSNNTSCS